MEDKGEVWGGVMQKCWGGSERWVNAGEGDKNDWFVFFFFF